MSNPIKHHYLPQFFLRRWAGPDGKVTEYQRPHDRVIMKRKFPSETGYEKELYSIPSETDPIKRQALESGFMATVDDLAARALQQMEGSGEMPADPELRSGWSRFLMSLIHRRPERLDYFRKRLRENDAETLTAIQAGYDELKGPSDPPTFDEYIKGDDEAITHETLARLLRMIIDSPRIGGWLNRMHWGIATVSLPKRSFLTSDTPLMMSNGIGLSKSFVALAVGPARFFIAANQMEVIRSFTSQDGNALIRAFNDAVARQARRLVIATDDSQRRFVENRLVMSGAPPPDNNMGTFVWNAPLA